MTTTTQNQNAVFQYFEADHDRLDTLFHNFQHYKRLDYPKAKTFFRDFKFGLQRHIIWEEEILFPLFEEKMGIRNGGPTEVMRIEHRMIGKALEELHQKVKRQDPESDYEEQALLSTLAAHNEKEEMILYPAIDRSLTDADQVAIFQKMKDIPEERYQNCCHHHATKAAE